MDLGTAANMALVYSVAYFPEHASDFERASEGSLYAILKEAISTDVARVHHMFMKGCACQKCDYGWVPKPSVTQAIHVAIGHSLCRYMEDYLDVKGDEGLPEKELNLLGPGCMAHSNLALRFLQGSDAKALLKKDVVRLYAVAFAIPWPGPGRLQAMDIAIAQSPTVMDEEILAALRYSSIEVIDWLLRHRLERSCGSLTKMICS
jgi:hypothetical protein